jgi:hypothetical protein
VSTNIVQALTELDEVWVLGNGSVVKRHWAFVLLNDRISQAGPSFLRDHILSRLVIGLENVTNDLCFSRPELGCAKLVG